jgi:signal transduction histidine kinase
MGLPISQTILENHGGEIQAQSKPGTDTLFRIRLPVAAGEVDNPSGDEC